MTLINSMHSIVFIVPVKICKITLYEFQAREEFALTVKLFVTLKSLVKNC